MYMDILIELALIFGVCLAGEGVAALLPIPFPASVISLLLMTVLLLTGAVKERRLQAITHFMIVNMGLFFTPALVGVIKYVDLLKANLIPFFAVTLLTTPVVYAVTAWTVLLVRRLTRRKGGGEDV